MSKENRRKGVKKSLEKDSYNPIILRIKNSVEWRSRR